MSPSIYLYARRSLQTRKTSLRGHGSFVGGTANDMPPPPDLGVSSTVGG
jgi:hypothetical protein